MKGLIELSNREREREREHVGSKRKDGCGGILELAHTAGKG